jgi:alkylation response protein AidB-like acyl-CoA dehydrogenase
MDFALNDEQRAWQMKARKFAAEELRPHSLERDAIPTAAATFDWEIIKKGSKLGFRTLAVPKEWGGYGTDFVTQAVVMAELAKADSAMSKALRKRAFCSSVQAAEIRWLHFQFWLKAFDIAESALASSAITTACVTKSVP